jgi:hypothetical protein
MLTKGLMLLGSVIAGGAALTSAPILTVTAPFWGFMGKTYIVNGIAAAGVAAAAGAGAGLGKVAGETGGAMVIEGLSRASQELFNKIKSNTT